MEDPQWFATPFDSLSDANKIALHYSPGLRLRYMAQQGMLPNAGNKSPGYVDTSDEFGNRIADEQTAQSEDEGIFGSGLGISELLMLLMFIPTIANTYFSYQTMKSNQEQDVSSGPSVIRVG